MAESNIPTTIQIIWPQLLFDQMTEDEALRAKTTLTIVKILSISFSFYRNDTQILYPGKKVQVFLSYEPFEREESIRITAIFPSLPPEMNIDEIAPRSIGFADRITCHLGIKCVFECYFRETQQAAPKKMRKWSLRWIRRK